jgi:RNA polymerase sigma-70 factor (ECF subfamily)
VTRDALTQARAGDERAFVELTAPFRDQLHRHCYRLLGSLHDADDALQETMLRAWRAIDRFEPRAPLRAWLYRIATNVCLRMLEHPSRRRVNGEPGVEPYPFQVCELPAPEPGPEAIVEARESMGLAFIAAMQLLPPKQRAVLVLRDVLGWPAQEVADTLDDSVTAVNSALQRARGRLARARADGNLLREHRPSDDASEARVIERFLAAWDAVDIASLVALLRSDAVMTMPPEEMVVSGASAIGTFFATEPLGGHLERIRLVRTRANGQPALAAFTDEEGEGRYRPYGLMVLAVDGDRIAWIYGFPQRPDLFERLGVPDP